MEYNFLKKDSKFYIKREELTLGHIEFLEKNNVIYINKVFVDKSFRGKGIANKLMKQIVCISKSENKKIKPICSFAIGWFENNKEYSNVLENYSNF